MPRKKQVDFNEEHEEEFEWDKPRIIGFFIVLFLLIAGGLFAKHYFFDASNQSSQVNQNISAEEVTRLPSLESVKQGMAQQVINLQTQASKISVQEIASSSPQVQQILQEIKQLPQAPGNFVRNTCMQVCNNL